MPRYQHRRMLTAHFPSGYIAGHLLARRGEPIVLGAAILGAVFPDIDMLWFVFVDGGIVHHHAYPTHWPLFWIALGLLTTLAAARYPRSGRAILALCAGALLHTVLDTIAAPIYWLMPFDNTAFELMAVPARYEHWIVSFLLHWTFALELTIWALAAMTYVQTVRK